ncbi:cation/calcium exchanger 2 [Syzygium oleosum]|uniref:cation/calcium exchanger 2 n=1 Tax=Syzygium oleosum TaxID=219896 RepID=UPI0024B9732E|nr:cation/calcium exchanger 2 [Syzygium oleosum]
MGWWVRMRGGRSPPVAVKVSCLLLACILLVVWLNSPSELVFPKARHVFNNLNGDQHACKALHDLEDYKAKCQYVKSKNPCSSRGYINYLYIFYCTFSDLPILGYGFLILWLVVLFYLLGNTASEYFCSSLESLSRLLKLSPTIAGVTLLSLGNGAPDVFASLVSFTGSGTQSVGLNTVLGGSSFVTCIVVGIISFLVHKRHIRVDKSAFVRDVCFLMLVLLFLLVILLNGEINLWGALGFLSMYVAYVVIVYVSHAHWQKNSDIEGNLSSNDGSDDLRIPILHGLGKEQLACVEETLEDGCKLELGSSLDCQPLGFYRWFLLILELPLYLPRRLTIPVASEERWSKPYAVASVTLAPLLLTALWSFQEENATFNARLAVYGVGFLIAVSLGVVAFYTTESSDPPKHCLFPWLAGGFVMSITWSYITAQELLGLLVSLGYIVGVSPSILGLTVLAWGNSLGDLMTNLTMAVNGGAEGTQVALSGCYAGPIFNMLFGLGLSLVGASWHNYPASVAIPRDPLLLETLGFVVAGLVWALVVLPRRDMKLDRVLGGGLLTVYIVALSLRVIQTVVTP